jgi:hypothetical protein
MVFARRSSQGLGIGDLEGRAQAPGEGLEVSMQLAQFTGVRASEIL